MPYAIPKPSKERLLNILRILEVLPQHLEAKNYTSAELEMLTGWPSNTIRKDISSLMSHTRPGSQGAWLGGNTGYPPETLVPLIKEALGLTKKRSFCIVGLGRLGSAYLNMDSLGEFELTAGFDINVNRIEILKSPVPLYPVYKMNEVIHRLGIEIALLCVPAEAAQNTAKKLVAAGIRGILNFAPVILSLPQERSGTVVRNVYVADELRVLAVKM